MRYSKLILAAVLGAGMQMAAAVPTPEEAAQLGKTLSGVGAIIAGNKEGTIPAWTPVCAPPAGYKPLRGLAEGGQPYIDIYAADKPLFKITAADVAKYADKLDEGSKELFRRFPQTFYISVYPTHRPACYEDWVYANSIKNVMRPRIVGGDVPSVSNAHAQVPFPIPKTGPEVMWNMLLKPFYYRFRVEFASTFVDSSGRRSFIDSAYSNNITTYWDNSISMVPEDQPVKLSVSGSLYPAAAVGTMQLRWLFARADLKGAPSWSYIPGQRRVRLAPDFAYDGVAPSAAGALLYDEINGFDGKMDRFDFKLIGRKEMYVPYNTGDAQLTHWEINTPNHIDPAAVRFELHRVWMVEATLKPGERHVQKRKVFYIDEDTWKICIYNGLDQADKVHHLFYYPLRQEYEKFGLTHSAYFAYDLAKRIYINGSYVGKSPVNPNMPGTTRIVTPFKASEFSPDGMVGTGVR